MHARDARNEARAGASNDARDDARDEPPERRPAVLRGLSALAGLALPSTCGGCGLPDRSWCPRCAARTALLCVDGPRPVSPTPRPPEMPEVWSAAAYAGPLRSALVAYKDGDRRDLGRVLAPLLVDALATVAWCDPGVAGACSRGERVWVVPVPSSRAAVRQRGDAPLERLLARAMTHLAGLERANHLDFATARALRLVRRVADQAQLDAAARAENLDRAMGARRGWPARLRGATCVLVDDVLTTGATLREATRVLEAAGAAHVAGATVAATRRRDHP